MSNSTTTKDMALPIIFRTDYGPPVDLVPLHIKRKARTELRLPGNR